jgi:putative transcriptional regulator
MTQKDLAEQVGVSRQAINAIENNKHSPTIEVAIRIADVFREDVSEVFGYEYEGKPDFMIVTVELDDSSDR